jgi:ATP-dependent Clp protease adapter protein ClpS
MDYDIIRQDANDHRYQLNVAVKNEGNAPVENYYMELRFPTAALPTPPTTTGGEVRERRTATHSLIRVTSEDLRQKLYPGDTINCMKIIYRMDRDLFRYSQVKAERVCLTVYVDGKKVNTIEKSFRDLQNF